MNKEEESILSWASRQQNTEKKIPVTEATCLTNIKSNLILPLACSCICKRQKKLKTPYQNFIITKSRQEHTVPLNFANLIKYQVAMGTTRGRWCSNQEKVTASHSSNHCQQSHCLIFQFTRHLNQTKLSPWHFCQTWSVEYLSLTLLQENQLPNTQLHWSLYLWMNMWWWQPKHHCNTAFLAGRQAVKGCTAALWLILILCCLFALNLAAKNSRRTASQILE